MKPKSKGLYLSRGGPKLESDTQLLDWFFTLRSKAQSIQMWHRTDPYEKDQPDDELVSPNVEDYYQLQSRPIQEAREDNKPIPSEANIMSMHSLLLREVEIKLHIYQERAEKEQAVRSLIMDTVHPDFYEADMSSLPEGHTLRQQVRCIMEMFGSDKGFLQHQAVASYQSVIKEAHLRNCEAEVWIRRWRKALTRAELLGWPFLGVDDFLSAAAVFSPTWVSAQPSRFGSRKTAKDEMTLLKKVGDDFQRHMPTFREVWAEERSGSDSTDHS